MPMPTSDPKRAPLFVNGPRTQTGIPFSNRLGRVLVWFAKMTAWGALTAAVILVAAIAIRSLWWAFLLLTRALGLEIH
jgi:hypothetical protein